MRPSFRWRGRSSHCDYSIRRAIPALLFQRAGSRRWRVSWQVESPNFGAMEWRSNWFAKRLQILRSIYIVNLKIGRNSPAISAVHSLFISRIKVCLLRNETHVLRRRAACHGNRQNYANIIRTQIPKIGKLKHAAAEDTEADRLQTFRRESLIDSLQLLPVINLAVCARSFSSLKIFGV